MKYDFNKAEARMRELNQTLKGEQVENREALEAEFNSLKREYEMENAMAKAVRENAEPVNAEKAFREQLSEICKRSTSAAISFIQQSGNTYNTKTSADAEGKTVNDILPTLEKGLIYQKVGLKMQTGVTNKLVWPYATSNIVCTDRNETNDVSNTQIGFANITASPKEHSMMVKLTNEAIDNTAFDIQGFVQRQITLAEQRYINMHMFSPAYFAGLTNPFCKSTSTSSTSFTNDTIDGTWKVLLGKIAEIAGKGYDMTNFAIIVNAKTKALLEATPKANGQGGFIIENDKLAGYPVFTTEWIAYQSTYSSSTHTYAFETSGYYLAMGCFNYLALCQHGVSRFIADATTLAEYNEVRFILHNTYSITDLSAQTIGGTAQKAFAIYKLNDCSGSGVTIQGDVQVYSTDAKPVKTKAASN